MKLLVFAAPVIAHGIYDSILFMVDVAPAISAILMLVFVVFCYQFWKYGSKHIKELLRRDSEKIIL